MTIVRTNFNDFSPRVVYRYVLQMRILAGQALRVKNVLFWHSIPFKSKKISIIYIMLAFQPDKLAPQAESPPSSPVVGQHTPTTTTPVVHQPTDLDVQVCLSVFIVCPVCLSFSIIFLAILSFSLFCLSRFCLSCFCLPRFSSRWCLE